MTTQQVNPIEYKLERAYAVEQRYEVMPVKEGVPDSQSPSFFWEWLPLGGKRFTVFLGINVFPSEKRPETIRVVMTASFVVEAKQPKTSLEEFVMRDAPQILYPLAVEVTTSLSARGAFQSYPIPVTDIVDVVNKAYSFQESLGFKTLQKSPRLAKSLGFKLPPKKPGSRKTATVLAKATPSTLPED